jgi:hypothetical protein
MNIKNPKISVLMSVFLGKAGDTCWNQKRLSAHYPDYQYYEQDLINDTHDTTLFDLIVGI